MMTERDGLLESKHCSRDGISTDRSSSCVSWYTSFKLSFRVLVIMMADRGITLTHTTILRWVRHYLPEFEKRWSRYARPVGGSWRMDETYMKAHARLAPLVSSPRRSL
jgi:transposase-like protein